MSADNIQNNYKKQQEIEQQIQELAQMPDFDYARIRKKKAKELGVRESDLDKEIQRHKKPEDTAKGKAIELYEPEPWPEHVNGADVLDEAVEILLRHMIMREADAYACVLWAAHTYIFDMFDHSPRLLITAPDAECGKTMLMTHMVGNMVNKPQAVELMKAAPFFRLAESLQPTFLIDEMDVFIKDDSDLLAAVNNGWEPHGGVPRCVGEDNEVRVFSTFCPTVMAGIELGKKLPSTTISRSIIINLERAAGDEITKGNSYDSKKHKQALLNIGRKLARWCRDNRDRIRNTDPQLPDTVRNRLANKWGSLFSIANAAGQKWPDKAKNALFSQVSLSEPSKSQQLLADIRDVIGDDRNISTNMLIDRICDIEESVWVSYNFTAWDEDKKRISSRQLANLLKRYNVHSTTVRTAYDSKTVKGYKRSDLEKAWTKYAPEPVSISVSPELKVTRSQSSCDAGCSDSQKVTLNKGVTDRKPLKSPPDEGCYCVTDNIRGGDDIEEEEQEKPRHSEVI